MIELYTPAIEDLWFKEKILSDKETMSYNHAYGGTIPFTKEKWESWHNRWIINHENKRFYRYITDNDTFIGEVAYRFDDEEQRYFADVIVYAPHRGKGYGRAALLLLCETAKNNGIQELYDAIAIDNPSVALFLKCGFIEVSRTGEYILVKKELDNKRSTGLRKGTTHTKGLSHP